MRTKNTIVILAGDKRAYPTAPQHFPTPSVGVLRILIIQLLNRGVCYTVACVSLCCTLPEDAVPVPCRMRSLTRDSQMGPNPMHMGATPSSPHWLMSGGWLGLAWLVIR